MNILVIGSGGAGLSLALRLPAQLRVAVLSKSRLEEGSTLYAQGGISAVTDPEDSFEAHIRDTLIAGAILIDVGKLIEYVIKDGQAVVGRTGKLLRHPFSGVGLAMRFGVPDEICHMIAVHSKEGDLGKRTTESLIIHHADFMSYEPFKADTLRV